MTLAIKFKIEDRGFKRLIKNFGDKAIPNLHRANLKYARVLRDSLKKQFVMQKKFAPRGSTASKFKAREINKREVGVFLPLKSVCLDSMRPRYVSIKRGRNITIWTQRYYGMMKKQGRSRVYKGPRGGIKPFSVLYVTPDPFIEKGTKRVRKKHIQFLKKSIRTTAQGGVFR